MPRTVAAADRVCAALQVLEHCQDVREDALAGRVYLPADDLAAAGVAADELTATQTSAALRGRRGETGRAVRAAAGIRRRPGGPAERLGPGRGGGLCGRRPRHLPRVAPRRPRRAGPGGRAVAAGHRDGAPRHLLARRPEPLEAPLAAAYAECERITREQARNFAWGIRLLPGVKRRALSAVYAFARRIDDIGDGDLPREEKLTQLSAARASIDAPPGDDPVLIGLADAAQRLPIPLAAFGDLVTGCEMDVAGRRYETRDELVEYCRCVAGSIGPAQPGRVRPRAAAR